MIKKLIVGFAFASGVFSLMATPISPEEALARLGIGTSDAKKAPGIKHVYTTDTETGNPGLYVFNRPANGGYMIASADDSAYPLLGYTDSGTFDAENIPPELKWWLEEYARQIQYVSEHNPGLGNQNAKKAPRVVRESIAPQIQTKWDQVAPFNNQCPLYGTERTYTGCVATAMAQVMNYWKYPAVGQGSISYDCEALSKRLSLNFANRRFDWDLMLDSYNYGQYSEEEAAAVAYLMKAAGYSVKMNYAPGSSGALAMNIANALKKYFNYDPNMLYTLRMYYSSAEWEEMIYDNLKNVGPILYGGSSMLGGGHSFVCDGYDGNGYFHFNWGWSGMSDGYFMLDALNPESLGSGGGSGGGYNFTQDAVFGIQPPTGLPEEERPLKMTQMGSLAGFISGDELKFDLFAEESAMWVNYNPTTMKIQFGAIFEPEGDTEGDTKFILVSDQAFSVVPGYGTDPAHLNPTVNLKEADLSDGTYKVTFATIPTEEENPQYLPVKECYGYYNYVVLKKDGDNYTLDINPVDRLSVKDGGIVGDLYYGCLSKVSITVANDNDIELTKGFAPALLADGAVYFLGESIYLTVQPGEEVTREWTTSFYLLQQILGIVTDTEFQFTFFDESTYNFYDQDLLKTVVMKPMLEYPQVTLLKEPKILDAEVVWERVDRQIRDVYVVKDRMNIDIEASFMLREGIFSYYMYACACPAVFSSMGSYDVEILSYSGYPMVMEKNEESPFNTVLALPSAEPGKYYMLLMAYDIQGTLMPVSNRSIVFRLDDPSEVDEILGKEMNSDIIYNLQGVSVGTDWNSLPSGLYIRNGKKVIKK